MDGVAVKKMIFSLELVVNMCSPGVSVMLNCDNVLILRMDLLYQFDQGMWEFSYVISVTIRSDPDEFDAH